MILYIVSTSETIGTVTAGYMVRLVKCWIFGTKLLQSFNFTNCVLVGHTTGRDIHFRELHFHKIL